MTKPNPKHNKKITTNAEMGVKKASKCSVQNCSEEASHHLSIANVEGYLSQMGVTLNEQAVKTKRVAFCKTHYKPYKKLKDKDDKDSFSKVKSFGVDKQKGGKQQSHAFLE